MFKKCLLILTAAGAIAMAVPLAAAQYSQSDDTANGQTNGQTSQTARSAHEHGCGHHHDTSDPAQCTAELTNRLNSRPISRVENVG